MIVWASKYRELEEKIRDLEYSLMIANNQRDAALFNLEREREALQIETQKRQLSKRQLSKRDLKKIRALTHPDKHNGKRVAHEISCKINELLHG